MAFDLLVRRYRKAVYGLCYRILGDSDDALDAAQDSFVKAYHSLESFRQDFRFSAWLFGIASNTCIDRIRKCTRQREDSLDRMIENSGEQPSQSATPEQALLRSETESRVQEAVLSLREMQRAALVMFHFNGMSIKEISQALGRPEGTVKYDLHEAREVLRRKLKGLIEV